MEARMTDRANPKAFAAILISLFLMTTAVAAGDVIYVNGNASTIIPPRLYLRAEIGQI